MGPLASIGRTACRMPGGVDSHFGGLALFGGESFQQDYDIGGFHGTIWAMDAKLFKEIQEATKKRGGVAEWDDKNSINLKFKRHGYQQIIGVVAEKFTESLLTVDEMIETLYESLDPRLRD